MKKRLDNISISYAGKLYSIDTLEIVNQEIFAVKRLKCSNISKIEIKNDKWFFDDKEVVSPVDINKKSVDALYDSIIYYCNISKRPVIYNIIIVPDHISLSLEQNIRNIFYEYEYKEFIKSKESNTNESYFLIECIKNLCTGEM